MPQELATTPHTGGIYPVNPETLIVTAIEKNVPVETMERLLAMRDKLVAEQARNAFFTDLAEFQRRCPVIVKDKDVQNKDGRSVRYRYAPLDSIIRQVGGLLAECGFSYQFTTTSEEKLVNVTCHARHRQGHTESTSFMSMIDHTAYMNLAQKFGSALTFGKRYAFLAAFGIMTGDDDDDSLSTSENTKTARERLEAIRKRQRRDMPNSPLVYESPATTAENAADSEPHNTGNDATSESAASDFLLTDFLTGAAEATEAHELTDMAHQCDEFEGPAKLTAKKAVHERALSLRFRWDKGAAAYVEGGAQ